jgi:hypothetical protein
MFLLTGTAFYRSIQLIILNKTHTLIVMAFKKYSIKSHYKVNKLVRIIINLSFQKFK